MALKGRLPNPTVIWDQRLATVALKFAQELASRGELSHRDLEGKKAADRALKEGLGVGIVGEILGSGERWEDVLTAWEKSPPHRQILEDAQWSRWGGARVPWGKTWIYVVLFWSPEITE